MTWKWELEAQVKDLETKLHLAESDARLAKELKSISDGSTNQAYAKIEELAEIVKSFRDEGMINGRALFEVFADAVEDWVADGWRHT